MMKVWLARGLSAVMLAALPCAVDAASLRIVPVDPVPGGHVSSERPAIEFEIHTATDVSVTRNEVHVTLDGNDAGRDLQIAGSRLEIVPHDRLSLGSHQVDVSVEDNSGERAVDHWTFTVDAQDAAVPTVRDDTAAAQAQTYDISDYAYGGEYAPAVYGGYGYGYGSGYGAYGSPYGYYPGAGAFFPVGFGPYYYGEPLRFIYSGLGLGGFVTIGGFPGTYPLVPFAPNYYFVTVPVPSWYSGGTPVVACNFPNHRRRLLSMGRVRIEHTRRPVGSAPPAWVEPHWRPTLAQLASLPGTPPGVRRMIAEPKMAAPPVHGVPTRRYEGPAQPHMVQLVTPHIARSVLRFAPMPASHFATVAAPRFAPVARPAVMAPMVRR